MADAKTYQGGCHCGAVRYEATLALRDVISCNCSICRKRGHLLAFVAAPDFKLVSGEDQLTDYLFNKHVIHHLFCRTCGVGSFARGQKPDGSPMVAINARCLDGVAVDDLTVIPFDGASR
jgi:hypothetical protein